MTDLLPPDPSSIVHDPRRLIALEAAHNVRDLGGYTLGSGDTVQWARLLRGDSPHRMTSADVAAMAALGLRTVIDLRTAGELDERGTFPRHQLDVEFVHLPVIDSTWNVEDLDQFVDDEQPEVTFLAWQYAKMLAEGGPRFGEAIRRLAEPGALPAIFHCAVGKDRTGILAALILSGLGVDDDVVTADYGLTASGIEKLRAFVEEHHPDDAQTWIDTPSTFLAAHPEAMQRLLDGIRADHGSIGGYLATVGVDASTLDALAAALTT